MLTMNELQKQAFEYYHAQQYAEMSNLLTREMDVFPVEALSIYYNWQMCAAALQGKVHQALTYFQMAVDAGCWYGRHALVDDPDLAALHGNPEFERLAQISQDRLSEAQANASPVLKVFPPQNAESDLDAGIGYPWLMLLHGNSSNLLPHNLDLLLTNLQPASDRGWLIALPQSSQLLNKDSYVWNDLDWSINEIQGHLETIGTEYPVMPAHGILSGYSMGGGLALYMALTGMLPDPFAVRSVTVAAPWWGNIEELEAAIAAGGADHLRIAMIVSQNDVDCHRVAVAVAKALKLRGLSAALVVTDEPDHRFPEGFRDLLTVELNAVAAMG